MTEQESLRRGGIPPEQPQLGDTEFIPQEHSGSPRLWRTRTVAAVSTSTFFLGGLLSVSGIKVYEKLTTPQRNTTVVKKDGSTGVTSSPERPSQSPTGIPTTSQDSPTRSSSPDRSSTRTGRTTTSVPEDGEEPTTSVPEDGEEPTTSVPEDGEEPTTSDPEDDRGDEAQSPTRTRTTQQHTRRGRSSSPTDE